MNIQIKSAVDFILRNAVWLIIGIVAVFFLRPGTAEIQTFLFIATLESIALSLSGIALYTYTKIPFTKLIMEGDDKELNSVERHSIMVVLGYIFLGVHILVGLVVLGVYIAQFSH